MLMVEPVVLNEEPGKENEQMLGTRKDEVEIEKFLQAQKSNTQLKRMQEILWVTAERV